MTAAPEHQEGGLDVIRAPGRAAAVLRPARLRLLRNLSRPNSASGLARKLSLPRQRVNYHLRELERAGFVELVEERRKGNCVERVFQLTARTYVISPEVFGEVIEDPGEVRDRFSASYLIALAARVIRELAGLRARAQVARKRLATLALETDVRFATAQDRNRFAEELATALARLASKYHDADAPQGRTFRIFVGSYPKPAPTPVTDIADSESNDARGEKA